jgi:hypothetical protein
MYVSIIIINKTGEIYMIIVFRHKIIKYKKNLKEKNYLIIII